MSGSNPYATYYVNQVGGGIKVFAGQRYQRGHGFFGKLFTSTILPALKYLGRQALSSGADVATDVLEGKSLKTAAKQRGIELGRRATKRTIEKAKQLAQLGEGRRRRGRRTITKRRPKASRLKPRNKHRRSRTGGVTKRRKITRGKRSKRKSSRFMSL